MTKWQLANEKNKLKQIRFFSEIEKLETEKRKIWEAKHLTKINVEIFSFRTRENGQHQNDQKLNSISQQIVA